MVAKNKDKNTDKNSDKKRVPKKYMLILQKKYGGQDAIQFLENGDAYTVVIEPFTDKTETSTNKKRTIQKTTMAFFDTITNRFKNFDQFLSIILKKDKLLYYKSDTSYIGYLSDGCMRTLPLSFNDPILAHIAFIANGNNINTEDKTTMDIVHEIVNLIEDTDSDFTDCLLETHQMRDKNFNFSRNLIDCIDIYHMTEKVIAETNANNSIMRSDINADIFNIRQAFLTKIKSYKNFRELYRFREKYLKEKINDSISIDESKKESTIDSYKDFKKQFEEVRMKNYHRPKQKKKDMQIPGQMSIFDLPTDS